MKDLVIQPPDKGPGAKGRSFRATLVSYVEARSLVPRGNDTTRPVHMTLAGTENELRPFVANLRTGKKAEESGRGRRGEKFEVLKSAGYQVTWQRAGALGSLVTLFAPDLFCLDPGMVDPKGVNFILLPAKRWLAAPDASIPVPDFVPEERVNDVRSLAALFIAYLDRRTRCPLIPDPRFYVQVLAHALNEGLAQWPRDAKSYALTWAEGSTFEAYGIEEAGFGPGLFFQSSHETLETFLAEQVRSYFDNAGVAAPARRAA